MSSAPFSVLVTARFERDYRSLGRRHADLGEHIASVLDALRHDPFNRSRRYPIKKLEGVPAGEGQYRFRSGRYRFRYDIDGTKVYLKLCALRREDTY